MQILVERFFHIDFILMDLLFCILWITLLLRRGYRVEFFIGLLGIIINFIADYVIWFTIQGVRTLDGPINPLLFFIYFSITYGMIEYSFVAIMFRVRENRERLFWTAILYLGWFLSGVASQVVSINDIVIHVTREMSLYRLPQILMIVGGYAALDILRRTWTPMRDIKPTYFIYLFFVGILVHFGMEFTLLMAGIRPSPLVNGLSEFLFNSFLEFNAGVPYLFMVWRYLSSEEGGVKLLRI